MKLQLNKPLSAAVLVVCLGWAQAALCETGNLPQLASEQATDKSSYATRILNARGVHEVDPNVYVYGPEFATRFQMPQEWVSDELKGVDAVAFRVVPGYKTCGWGGNPQACREDEVRCEMDLYFDHQRNPLPWDERRPQQYSSVRNLSAYFLWAGPRSDFRQQQLITPPRPGDIIHTQSSPFVDSKTGKGLGWQDYMKGNSFGGWIGTLGYDREMFQGVSLVSLGAICGRAPHELWLASNSIDASEISRDPALNKRIQLPEIWRSRVAKLLEKSDQRSKAFFKDQGEKALKALQETPVPNKPIVPLQ